jgi:hypothetical protein
MAIVPQQQRPQESQAGQGSSGSNLDPKPGMTYWEYFQYLIGQGLSATEAGRIIRANPSYGTVEQYNARQTDQAAKAERAGALGNVVGATGVALGAKYILGDAAAKSSPALANALTARTGDQITWAQKAPGGGTQFQGTTAQGENILGVSRKIPDATLDLDQLAAQQGQGSVTGAQYQGPTTQTTTLPDQQYTIGETTTIQTNAGPREVPVEAAADAEFVQGTDWNQVGSGALAALQAYQAFQSLKSKDYVGAGISGTTAGLGAGAAIYGQNSAAAQALPYAGVASGLYGAYQTAKLTGSMPKSRQRATKSAASGAAAGAAIGSVGGPIGMGIGAGVGALAGYAGSKFGSSKGKAQTLRDNIRSTLQEKGVLDDKYQGTLADGSTFDFGKDGSELKWSNIQKVADANRDAWDATSNAAGSIAAFYDLTGQKNADVAAWLQNAAVSNANNDPKAALANIRHIARQQGVSYSSLKSNLDTALADNKINKSQYDQYIAGARDVFGGEVVKADVKPRARMSTQEKEEDRKKQFSAAGFDLDNIGLDDLYRLYQQGAISDAEWDRYAPKPGGLLKLPRPRRPQQN